MGSGNSECEIGYYTNRRTGQFEACFARDTEEFLTIT